MGGIGQAQLVQRGLGRCQIVVPGIRARNGAKRCLSFRLGYRDAACVSRAASQNNTEREQDEENEGDLNEPVGLWASAGEGGVVMHRCAVDQGSRDFLPWRPVVRAGVSRRVPRSYVHI